MELNKIYNEHALETMAKMPDEFLDCVTTSPPYYGLRAYSAPDSIWGGDKDCEHIWREHFQPPNGGKSHPERPSKVGANKAMSGMDIRGVGIKSNFCSKCSAWRGQLGLEPDFKLYISHLMEIFREVKRVLKKDGTCWVNLGDSYTSSGGASRHKGYTDPKYPNGRSGSFDEPTSYPQATLPKSLMNIPARFAIAMTDELQFIERNEIIWHKPACMPSSAKDRFTVDFEKIFFFTKSERYYFEQQTETAKNVGKIVSLGEKSFSKGQAVGLGIEPSGNGAKDTYTVPENRNMRTTWSVNYEPSSENHFASYPTKLIETPIKAGCPNEICNQCGKAPIVAEKTCVGSSPDQDGDMSPDYEVKMKRGCKCSKPHLSPGIVYDPFAGTGTTLLVAHKLGRNWIGSEISAEYCELANKRLAPYLAQNQLF
jgi:DNA modification methylase